MVLYCGESNGEFQLTVEPLIGGHSEIGAEACTEELLNTLEAIPESMAKLLQRCHQRLFDYGFDGGFDAKPCSVDIPREQLSRAMRLGIGMRVTVYPYRSDSRIKKGEVDA